MFGYRYSVMDESTGSNSRGDNHTETTYGISKYFAGHSLKIQADYVEMVEEKAGKDATDDIIRIQAQLKF
jgi:phosphate-selective porin